MKLIETVHPYAITQVRGLYKTKVSLEGGKRKDITAKTKEAMYIKLAEYYGESAVGREMTCDHLYEKWMEHRTFTIDNSNTILRDRQHYARYFEGHPFFMKKLKEIKAPMLKEFCCSVIRGETTRHTGKNAHTPGTHLTRKEWTNTKSILNGMFSYAVENEWMSSNPLRDMHFDRNLFRVSERKVNSTEVFNTDEEALLKEWCLEQFEKAHDAAYLFPILNIEAGMRIGEAVALKWEDWDGGRKLRICKEEFKDRVTNEITVVDHTKTHTDRTVILTKGAMEVLQTIRKYSPEEAVWIFERNGIRIHSRAANYVLEKFAKHNNVQRKASHKLRKTFGSKLHQAGFSARQCADYIGNTERVFLDHYSFNTETEEETIRRLDAMCL